MKPGAQIESLLHHLFTAFFENIDRIAEAQSDIPEHLLRG
jgi:hypothetical protein